MCARCTGNIARVPKTRSQHLAPGVSQGHHGTAFDIAVTEPDVNPRPFCSKFIITVQNHPRAERGRKFHKEDCV